MESMDLAAALPQPETPQRRYHSPHDDEPDRHVDVAVDELRPAPGLAHEVGGEGKEGKCDAAVSVCAAGPA